MNMELIADLAKDYLDKTVAIALKNGNIGAGKWFFIDTHAKVIGVIGKRDGKTAHIYIDCDDINMFTVKELEND